MESVSVSVIVPTFHREVELREAIDSVLSQRNVALEIIVVDDSAGGSARETVEALGDPRVRYMVRREPSNGRPALVRNDGAAIARGRYLYFLDDDDILEPGALHTLRSALEAAPGLGMAFGGVVPFGSDEAQLKHNQSYFIEARRIARKLADPRRLGAYLTFRPTILICSACMARREAFLAVGGFDPEIPVCEDTEFWARIARTSGHVFVDTPVVRYRTGRPSLMNDMSFIDEKLVQSYQRILKKYKEENGVLQYVAMKCWARFIFR